MPLAPLPGGNVIDRQGHDPEPDPGPHLCGSRLHRPVGLPLRDETFEAEPKVAPGLPALLIQQIVVALHEEQPRDGGLARGARDELPGELGELLAGPNLERIGVPYELAGPAGGGSVQLVEEVLL